MRVDLFGVGKRGRVSDVLELRQIIGNPSISEWTIRKYLARS